METKHTPGPWHLDDEAQPDYVFSRDMKMIATLRGEGDELPLIANARLIAAAPDLLEALEHMVAVSNWATTIQSEEQYDAMITKAEAAIRKAKGE
jgi:hypothetical protein